MEGIEMKFIRRYKNWIEVGGKHTFLELGYYQAETPCLFRLTLLEYLYSDFGDSLLTYFKIDVFKYSLTLMWCEELP